LRRRRIEALYRLLERVSDKKRAVYVLHELEGMTPNEISKVVGAPVLTVRTRLFYARREVLAMLREEPALAAIADELAAPESPRKTSVGEAHKEPA
jgi:RNA polymerase sigma-70 factor (ECF subfamily)